MPGKKSTHASVSLRKELRDAISVRAKMLHVTVPNCIKIAFEFYQSYTSFDEIKKRLGIEGEQIFNWYNPETQKVFNALFDTLNSYKSTEWIMSDNHDKDIGGPAGNASEWPEGLKKRIINCEEFEFEKILIIADNVWESRTVRRWILQKFLLKDECPDRRITISVARQKKIDKSIDRKYYDMGIYEDERERERAFVGFLSREGQENKAFREYKWVCYPDKETENEEIPRELKEAKKSFERIREVVEPPNVVQKMLFGRLVGQSDSVCDSTEDSGGL